MGTWQRACDSRRPVYVGATIGFGTLVPLLDVEFGYLHPAGHGRVRLGAFRFGTGIRCPFWCHQV